MGANINTVEAEEWRRSHCDRAEVKHLCVGEVSLKPGMFCLDCKLCGTANEILDLEGDVSNAARNIARIFQVDYDLWPVSKRKQLLIELLAIQQ